MKKLFVLSLLLIISGCGSSANWQGNLDCNMSAKEIVDNSIRILKEEGFTISCKSDSSVSAIQNHFSSWDGYRLYQWFIEVSDKKIIASSILFFKNRYVFLGDETPSNVPQYWRVRHKLEKLCANKMIIIDILENANTEDDEIKK
jgi:hypothetical protein